MWNDIINALKGIASVPSDVGKSFAEIGTIWATLTNYRMWRSLGWLFLGILVTVLGLVIWNRHAVGSAFKAAGKAGEAAAVA